MDASCTPGTTVLPRPACIHRPAPAASQRPVPAPSPQQPIREGRLFTRHQRRFTRFTRPVSPSPVTPGWNGRPWASTPGFVPRDSGARQGGDRPPSTNPELRYRHQPTLQTASPLETCDLVSQMQDETSQNPREEDERAQKAVLGLLLRPTSSDPGRWMRWSARWGRHLRSPTPLRRCTGRAYFTVAAISCSRVALR